METCNEFFLREFTREEGHGKNHSFRPASGRRVKKGDWPGVLGQPC